MHEEGLTARVFRLDVGGRRYAVKVARAQSLVRNDDGRTSFPNELRRHAELHDLRAAGSVFPGVVAPLYGSLRAGVIVSPWIDGVCVDRFDARRIRQLLASGNALVANGFFEWDFSPGNLIDDGAQVWLFDFGYMYRFDPLTQFNSAGRGDDCPQFHLAERVETRNAFAWLLELDDDLHGQTCTPRTLARADWLVDTATAHQPALQAAGALFGADLDLARDALVRRYLALRAQAGGFLLR